eukprot:576748-Pyramimonas_sp.AAC.1
MAAACLLGVTTQVSINQVKLLKCTGTEPRTVIKHEGSTLRPTRVRQVRQKAEARDKICSTAWACGSEHIE